MRRRTCWPAMAALILLGCASSSGSRLPDRPVAFGAKTIDGSMVSLGALRGNVVLVTIFTTWNDYALLEVPRLAKLTLDHRDDLRVLALALDDDRKMVEIFAQTFEVPYYVAHVSRKSRILGPDGPFGPIDQLPTSVLIDRDGRIVARSDGTWPPRILEAAVQKLIEEGANE